MEQKLKRMLSRMQARSLLTAVVAAVALLQPGVRGVADAQGTVIVKGWVDTAVQSYMSAAQWDYVKSTTAEPFGRVQQTELGPTDETVTPPATVKTLAQVLGAALEGQGTAGDPWYVTRGVEWDGYGNDDAVPLKKTIGGVHYRFVDHKHTGAIAACVDALEGTGPVCLKIPAGYYEEWELTIPANVWVQGEGEAVLIPRTPYPYPPTSDEALAAGEGRKRLVQFTGKNGGLSDVIIDGAGRPEVTGIWVSNGCTGVVIANNTIRDLRGADLAAGVTGWAPAEDDPPVTKTKKPVATVVANRITHIGRSGVRAGPNWLVRSNYVTYAGLDREPGDDESAGDCGIIADGFTVGVRTENNLVVAKELPAARHAIATQNSFGPVIQGNICILVGAVRGGIALADHTDDATVSGNVVVCVVDPAECPGPATCPDPTCLTGASTHRTHEGIIAFGDRNNVKGNAVVGTIFGVKVNSNPEDIADGNVIRYNYLEVGKPWKDKAKTQFTAARADSSATNTTISNNWAAQFPATHVMGKPDRPDIVVSDASGWMGYGIYNTTGADQKTAHDLIAGKEAGYTLRAYNDSATQQVMRIVGPGDHRKWHLRYLRENGEDVTAQVTGDGWTPTLPAGGYAEFGVRLRAEIGVAEGATHKMLVQAGFDQWGDSEFDAQADAGKLTTRIVLPPQQERPDVWVLDGPYWIGENIYNTTGAEQKTTRDVFAGKEVVYKLRVYNDSTTQEVMRVVGPGDQGRWHLTYTRKGGEDVTAKVTGDGWKPTLPSGGYAELHVWLRAEATLAEGAAHKMLVRAGVNRWSDSEFDAQADTGKLTTRIVLPPQEERPDVSVLDGQYWIGDNAYDTTGGAQKTSRDVFAGTETVYKLRVHNDATTEEVMRVVGPGDQGMWRLTYVRKNGEDVTAEVTGDGWKPTLPAGEYTQLHVRLRAEAGLAVGAAHKMLVQAGFNRWSDLEFDAQADAGKFTTRVVLPPQYERSDVLVLDGPYWIGDNVYDATGAGQKTTHDVFPGKETVYKLRIYNDSASQEVMRVVGPGDEGMWGLSYAPKGGEEVTAEVTGDGWKPTLPAGGYAELHVWLRAEATLAVGAAHKMLVQAGFDRWSDSTFDAQADAGKLATRIVLPPQEERPDLWILEAPYWIGDNTYDPTGASQKSTRDAVAGTETVYKLRVYNDSTTQEVMRVVGPAAQGKWGLAYARKEGEDVTAQVTGDGWNPTLPAGGYTELHVRVRAEIGQAEGDACKMLVQAGFDRWSDSEFDAQADAGGLTTRIVLPPQQERPDVLVVDGTAWMGDNIYNTNGNGQTTTSTISAGAKVTYKLRVYNDSTTTEKMRIMGEGSADKWSVTYTTADGADVTEEMTTTGWCPDLNPGDNVELRVRVHANWSLAAGSNLPVLVHGGFDKWDAPTYLAQADVGKLTTRVASDTSAAIQLTGLSTVPTTAGAQLTFTLTSAASVSARVLNIAGRPVKTLFTSRDCGAGTNTLLWNATSDRGTSVPNGTYLVEVAANGPDGGVARGLARAIIRR